ncbi:hypothetical protein BURMUCGD2M_1009 [Burkholderia multivorans CGD2M]|uniref:Uncharacterized protein n=1 Tax=Burkholderia multivorans CGD2 TaxID=513052 RepID=B9BRA0_9BURK|nr:hypothetical protein BURMUCGD2_0918 [Burkholderia multivorans CGD2]EEE12911.1 hypothetical protein BURMUCGD2M_1009 [Burkholderia multivorans CGD2M]
MTGRAERAGAPAARALRYRGGSSDRPIAARVPFVYVNRRCAPP